MKQSRLWAASLSTALVIVIASAASATPTDAVIAPADTVTIEVLESNTDFVSSLNPGLGRANMARPRSRLVSFSSGAPVYSSSDRGLAPPNPRTVTWNAPIWRASTLG